MHGRENHHDIDLSEIRVAEFEEVAVAGHAEAHLEQVGNDARDDHDSDVKVDGLVVEATVVEDVQTDRVEYESQSAEAGE